MSFPKYEAYKDSGVEWLGEVPEHWEVLKLKRIASFQSGNFITSDSIEPEGVYPVFGGNGLRGYTNSYTHKGDFALIGRQGALCGNINYGTGQFWASEHAVVVSPHNNVITKWIGELLRSMNLNQYSVSAAQPGLAVERIIDLYIPYPNTSEQTQIARFLDYETARIDALIAEQQRLIELLKEKRQAVISHAVTKGLDPTAPLKDSGIEWLGEVPTHWEILKLARVLQTVEQGWSPNASNEAAEIEKWGVIKISAVKKGNFVETENKALFEDTLPDSSLKVRKGDLLVTRANTPDLVGDTCVVDKDPDSHLMLSDLTYRLRLSDKIDAKFICFFLLSSFGRAQIKGDARGSSMSMAKISQGHIKGWIIALPEYDEQLKITEHLSVELEKMNCLMETCNETKKLLQERRSALISAAVTGKIDVRGWQAPASAAPAPTLEVAHG